MVTKTPEAYGKIIEGQKKEIKRQAKRIKELEDDQLLKGSAKVLRAEAYKEGYETCRAQMDTEKEELKAELSWINWNINRFINLKMSVSEFYKRSKEGF
jgi:hypothetical protein